MQGNIDCKRTPDDRRISKITHGSQEVSDLLIHIAPMVMRTQGEVVENKVLYR